MKESYNVFQRIALESEIGFTSVFHIDREEEVYEEAARFSIDLCKNPWKIMCSHVNTENSFFEIVCMMSASLFAEMKNHLQEGEYVFVVKTQARVRIAAERCYDLTIDAPKEGDPRRKLEEILGKTPRSKIETLLDISF